VILQNFWGSLFLVLDLFSGVVFFFDPCSSRLNELSNRSRKVEALSMHTKPEI
jgi:hypothetical protein